LKPTPARAAGVEVSWQVTGVRRDAWAEKNRIQVEEDKTERERGFYLHPEAFDQPAERCLDYAKHPDRMKQAKEVKEQRVKQRGGSDK
jgi:hypothetical protein